MSQNVDSTNIVFFDGYCGLCNGFINMLIKINSKKKLLFSPLQGETAKKIQGLTLCEDSIVFYSKRRCFLRSNAVLEILFSLGGFWRFVLIFKIIPRFIRDFVYRVVAKNRYHWFGKTTSCRIPTEAEKQFFLP